MSVLSASRAEPSLPSGPATSAFLLPPLSKHPSSSSSSSSETYIVLWKIILYCRSCIGKVRMVPFIHHPSLSEHSLHIRPICRPRWCLIEYDASHISTAAGRSADVSHGSPSTWYCRTRQGQRGHVQSLVNAPVPLLLNILNTCSLSRLLRRLPPHA